MKTGTGRFREATEILLVLVINKHSAIFLEAGERGSRLRTHQPAITGNIGSEYSGEFALDLIRSHLGFPPVGFPLRITADSGDSITSISPLAGKFRPLPRFGGRTQARDNNSQINSQLPLMRGEPTKPGPSPSN